MNARTAIVILHRTLARGLTRPEVRAALIGEFGEQWVNRIDATVPPDFATQQAHDALYKLLTVPA